MSKRIVVLGAGFGGLELCTVMSEAVGEEIEVTLIDKADAFVFGFSKLDVMFGRTTLQAARLAYSDISKPGIRVLRETITAIDPEARRVTTDAGVHEADALVIALGADYDMDATPGLAEGGNEFYSVAGAERLAEIIPTFSQGHVVIGVCGAPFKCPPAPSECALLLHDELTARGVRDACQISFVMPLSRPVPPSPETSEALEREFAERDIAFIGGRRINQLDPRRKCREARRRQRAVVRLVPGGAKASRPRCRDRQRHDRGRLHTGRLGDAQDAFSRGVRRGRRGNCGRTQGRRVRRGRSACRSTDADRRAIRRRVTGTPPGARYVLHRVRSQAASAAWTSISSPVQRKPAPSTRHQPSRWRSRSASAPVAGRAGSAADRSLRRARLEHDQLPGEPIVMRQGFDVRSLGWLGQPCAQSVGSATV